MSEERFDRLEQKVDALAGELRSEMAAQGTDLRSEMATQGAELRSEMAAQGTDLRSELAAVGIALSKIQQQSETLRQQMLVLHEDTIGRIAALAPDFAPIRREFAAADAQLREEIDRRLTPLEADARRRRS